MLFYFGDSLVDTGNITISTTFGLELGEELLHAEEPNYVDYFLVNGSVIISPGSEYNEIDRFIVSPLIQQNPTLQFLTLVELSAAFGQAFPNYFDGSFDGNFAFTYSNPDNPTYSASLVDFSASGGTTDYFGSSATNTQFGSLDLYRIGFKSQVDYMVQSFKEPAFRDAYLDSDAVVIVGGNDVIQFLDSDGDGIDDFIFDALETETTKDDDRLIDKITGTIFKNIKNGVNKIEKYLDSIAVGGIAPLHQTPKYLGLDPNIAYNPQLLGFIEQIVETTNDKIEDYIIDYNSKPQADDLLIYVDTAMAFSKVIKFESFDGDHVTYTGGAESTTLDQYRKDSFNDLIHPKNGDISEMLAMEVADQIRDPYSGDPDFALG